MAALLYGLLPDAVVVTPSGDILPNAAGHVFSDYAAATAFSGTYTCNSDGTQGSASSGAVSSDANGRVAFYADATDVLYFKLDDDTKVWPINPTSVAAQINETFNGLTDDVAEAKSNAADAQTVANSAVETANNASTRVTTLETIENRQLWEYTPITWAHRGGAAHVPEQSAEGEEYAYQHGFPLECDIQFLSDGVPVLCHDATVDRTMTNITSGNVSDKTSAEWAAATIVNPIPGGKPGRPLFFEEYLDRWGGRILLVPEIKTNNTSDQAQTVIDMVVARGLQQNVVIQSFTYAYAQMVANAGCRALYLYSAANPSQSYSTIKSDGIEFVGPSLANATSTTVGNAKAAGLKVVGWTAETPDDMTHALAIGCDGVFSNDPEWTSGRLQIGNTPDLSSGFLPAGVRLANETDANGTLTLFPGGIGLDNSPGPNHTTHITSPWAGKRKFPVTVKGTFHYNPYGSINANGGFGITWLNHPISDFQDGALAGQEGITCSFRARGDCDAWSYINGAAAAATITGDDSTAEPFKDGGSTSATIASVDFSVQVTETDIVMCWGDKGNTPKTATAAHNLTNTDQLYELGLRVTNTTGWFSNVTVFPY